MGQRGERNLKENASGSDGVGNEVKVRATVGGIGSVGADVAIRKQHDCTDMAWGGGRGAESNASVAKSTS